jgi:hypothetical protein
MPREPTRPSTWNQSETNAVKKQRPSRRRKSAFASVYVGAATLRPQRTLDTADAAVRWGAIIRYASSATGAKPGTDS